MADLKSMAMSASEAKDMYSCVPGDSDDAPRYPYGTQINLRDAALKALGVKDMPAAGATMMIVARVKVSGTRSEERQGGVENCIDLQITDMALTPEQSEQEAADTLYGKGS